MTYKVQNKKVIDYIHELAVMKRRTISGFEQFTKKEYLSLAAHSFRSSIIGMILAELEGANMSKVTLMLIVHENGEVRVGDADFIASKYGLKSNDFEKNAYKDQVRDLPENFSKIAYSLFKEMEKCESIESKVAQDANILEHIFSAKELFDEGVDGAKLWLNHQYTFYTDSAKRIFEDLKVGKSYDWIKSI